MDLTDQELSALDTKELERLAAELKNRVNALNNKQTALKITLNSAYGALASEYFRWFDIRLAEAITLSGQCLINWVNRDLCEYLNTLLKTLNVDYCIAMDTDSMMFDFGIFVDKFFAGQPPEKITDMLDAAAKGKFAPLIAASVKRWCDNAKVASNRIGFERDVIADRALFLAKKRYILQMRDKEGVRYKEPKIKVTGAEAKRSDKPMLARKQIEESYKILLNHDQAKLLEFLAEVKQKFMTAPFELIAFPRGISELSKFVNIAGHLTEEHSVPIHASAAWLYNKLLKEKGLEGKYRKIKDGDKLKYLFLKHPNPTGNHVLGFLDDLPKEFELDNYIDREVQYEKAFLQPIRGMTDLIGWYVEKVDTLDDFF